MAEDPTFQNWQNLVSQYRTRDFEGFTVQVGDTRNFEDILEGRLEGINLYSVPENQINKLEGLDNWLKGHKVDIIFNGETRLENVRISDAELRPGGSSESISFDTPYDHNAEARDVLDSVNSGISLRDYIEREEFDTVTFQAVETETDESRVKRTVTVGDKILKLGALKELSDSKDAHENQCGESDKETAQVQAPGDAYIEEVQEKGSVEVENYRGRKGKSVATVKGRKLDIRAEVKDEETKQKSRDSITYQPKNPILNSSQSFSVVCEASLKFTSLGCNYYGNRDAEGRVSVKYRPIIEVKEADGGGDDSSQEQESDDESSKSLNLINRRLIMAVGIILTYMVISR